ncbi:hypothetical protein VTK56DRAFT_4894 [Thermocarpiscus australiensis]
MEPRGFRDRGDQRRGPFGKALELAGLDVLLDRTRQHSPAERPVQSRRAGFLDCRAYTGYLSMPTWQDGFAAAEIETDRHNKYESCSATHLGFSALDVGLCTAPQNTSIRRSSRYSLASVPRR